MTNFNVSSLPASPCLSRAITPSKGLNIWDSEEENLFNFIESSVDDLAQECFSSCSVSNLGDYAGSQVNLADSEESTEEIECFSEYKIVKLPQTYPEMGLSVSEEDNNLAYLTTRSNYSELLPGCKIPRLPTLADQTNVGLTSICPISSPKARKRCKGDEDSDYNPPLHRSKR